jgi:hypothetical protein
MDDQRRADPDVDGDSSDVVTGPIGGANFVEPTKADDLGADLDELPMKKSDEQVESERT